MGFGAPPGVTKHTELTDKEVAAIIDHADLSVSDAKLASGVGLTDGQICKLPTAVLNQILKRGALAWEVGAIPTPVFEGDYSTWSEKWQQDFADGVEHFTDMTITVSPDYVYILYEDDSAGTYHRFAILNIGDGSEKFLSPSGERYGYDPQISTLRQFAYNTLCPIEGGGASLSIQGKYVLILRYGSDIFEVWKDGVKVFTSPSVGDVVAGDNAWQHALIRYDGKYIIVITYPSLKIVCFEGS